MKLEYFGTIIVPILTGFALGLVATYAQTPINVLSIYLAIISIGVALAIFVFQQIQGGKIKEISEELHEILTSKRRAYADGLLFWVHLLFEQRDNLLNAYNRISAMNFQTENDREIFIKDEYKRLLQELKPEYLTIKELVGTFTDDVLIPFGRLERRCRMSISLFDTTDSLVNNFQEVMNDAEIVREALFPYASEGARDLFNE